MLQQHTILEALDIEKAIENAPVASTLRWLAENRLATEERIALAQVRADADGIFRAVRCG